MSLYSRNAADVRCSPEADLVAAAGEMLRCAITVRLASRRTAAKFASLFDEAGGGARDMTELDRTGEHAYLSRCWPVGANPLNDD